MKRASLISNLSLALLLISGALIWRDALAQAPDMQTFAEQAGFFSGDLRLVVARLIRTVISFAGIILVIMLIVGAVQYMTAGGEQNRIDTAKKTIMRAIIGLVIVVSSFVIAQFVVNQVTKAVGGGGIVGEDDGGCVSCLGDGHINAKRYFALSSWNEKCAPLVRNFAPQFVFTQPVARGSVVSSSGVPLGIVVKEAASGTVVNGSWSISGKTAMFVPNDQCPGQATEHCFSAATDYSVEFKQTVLRSASGRTLTCGGNFLPCVLSFTTGTVVDTRAPTVTMTNPSVSGASGTIGDIFPLQSRVQDETGASLAEFFVDDARQSVFAATLGTGERPSPDRIFNTDTTEWNTKGYPVGLRQIWAKGADCAGHSGVSAKVPFSLLSLTCGNKKQDGNETGVDCGGSCPVACEGQPCVKNSDCAVGLACRNNVCVASPRIDRVTPGDGKPGNLVTISGLGFGSSPGTVKFIGELEADGDDVVIPPYAGCSGAWSDKQVIIRLENAMKSGPIQLIATDTTKTDRTDDEYGSRISDFEINDIARPGVCSITPPTGKGGISAVLAGNGFGASRGTSGTVYYGNTLAAAYGLWSDTSTVTTVPLLDSQVHAVQLFAGENLCAGTTTACRTDADCGTGTCVKGRQGSNTVSFAATSDADRVVPIITSIETGWRACNDQTTDAAKKLKHCGADGDCPGGACVAAPNWGPAGQYVTIYGSKFGTSGLVRFRSKTDRKEAIGDTAFPEQCGSGIWKDGFVVIKVPKQFLDGGFVGAGTYEVSAERSGLESAPKDFVVVDELPGPGICRVNPSAGPVGQSVSVFGEHFVGDSGRVVFNDQKESPMTEPPLETSLRTIVPTGAVTGPMFVERTAPGVFKSNSVNFAVGNCKNNANICGAGEQCCANGSCSVECAEPVDAHYAYLFSTGPIPKTPRVLVACTRGGTVSPSPWDGWSKPGTVCVDAMVTAEFGPSDIEGMDWQSVRDNLKIEKCSATGTNPCRTTEIVSGGSINGTGARIFTWDFTDAAKNFEPNTTYRVTLGKDIQSSSNIVDRVETGLVAMGAPFSWQFKTSSGTCEIGSLAVSPSEAAITELNGTKDYLALPEAKEDQCIVLSCSGHSVAWTSDDTNKAEMIGRTGSSNQCEDTAKGLRETLGTPVKISATMTDIAVRPKDDALLTVDFVDPKVVDYWPNCDQACVNAEIGAAFNTLMNRSTVTSSSVHVGKCDNADCLAPSPIAADVEYPVAGAPYEMRVSPRVALERNGYYRVTVDAGVSSLSDIKMKTAFQWQFRVKNTGELCQIDKVQLQPKDSTLSRVGARQEIGARAVSKPDECSVNGQRLNAEMLSWSPWWTTDKAPDKVRGQSIGTMLASKGAAEGEIKKFPSNRLPAWCSPSCLNLGSVVQSGEPVCGNDRKEIGEDCDDGNAENGDGCSARCLFEPSLKCGKFCEGTNTVCADNTSCPSGVPCEERTDSCCGDGTVQPFEQCDPTKPETLRCSDVCLNQGTSQELCGNGYPESGESCDGGSGCTTHCLHTGSVPRPASGGVCGNGRIEEGEECDGSFGCGSFCVWEGTPACVDKVCQRNGVSSGVSCVNKSQCQAGEECDYPVSYCCGNGDREKGEDCDYGDTNDGDGCSSHCLNEGSSVSYIDPSFCGDGELEAGEECEAPSAGAIGPYGAMEISRFAPQEVDEKTGKAVAVVSAEAQGKTGTAEVSLQCSCERDDACGNAVSYGCGKAKCCYDRPAIEAILPADGTEGRCRNVAISALFSKPMDVASFDQSVDANKDGKLDANEFKPNAYLEILTKYRTSYANQIECPDGTTYAMELPLKGNWLSQTWQMIGRAIRSFIANDAEAIAPRGCFVPLVFKAQGKSVSFEYRQALAENSWYRLTIVGDSDPTNRVREGALSEDLVGLSFPSTIRTAEFKTGGEICTIGTVDVQDNGKKDIAVYENPSKFLFTKSGERHGFVAKALSAELLPPNNLPQEIAPTTAYGWNWSWSSTKNDGPNPPAAEDNIVTTEFVPTEPPTAMTNADVVAGTKNGGTYKLATKSGEETVIATATITTENPPKDVYGQALVRAELCENPSIQASPFEDNAMNFSFFYCRDSGEEGNTQDDLNDVEIQVVPNPISDILKELLVKIDGTPDAIGIRIAGNPKYLTPSEWYAEKGFRGSPSPVVADGYSAVQDGATWYIAAPNQSKEDGKEVIYSNIYIVSYNQNASAASKEIFARILSSWRFNSDITNLQICKNDNDTGGYFKPTGSSSYVSCASDQDCAVQKCVKDKCSVTGHACANDNECIGKGTSGFICDADKSKLQRDFKRIFDAVRVQDMLFRYGVNHKRCSITRSQTCSSAASCPGGEECLATVPSIETGSFIRSMSVSVWPSWGAVLGNALGQSLPNDPINAFRTCSGAGYAGYDPVTCYNAAENKFSCSKNSFVYGFKSLFGDRYEWRANLEYGKAGWVNKVKKYEDTKALIVLQYPEGSVVASPESGSGFTTTDLNFCRDEIVGDSDACGDGIKGANETCEVGDVSSGVLCKVCYSPDAKKTGLACTAPADCTNTCVIPLEQATGKCKQSGEECQNNDGCVNTGWACMDGKKDAKCLNSGANACKEYETAEQSTARCAVAQCGNGIVESGESCDAGTRNGSYGVACSPQCTLFGTDTFYCGDGYLAGGEQCDCGTVANYTNLSDVSWAKISGNCNGAASGTNGQYVADSSKSCSFDCKRPGPSCGDGIVNGVEQCDPASLNASKKEQKGIGTCTNVTSKLCNTDADCVGGTCTLACQKTNICTVGDADKIGKQCVDPNECFGTVANFCTIGDAAKLGNPCGLGTECGTGGVCSPASEAKFCTRGDAAKLGNPCVQNVKCGSGGVCSPATCSDQKYQLKKSMKCENTCKWSAATNCSGEIQRCGDGIKNGNEDCDDGDTDNTDACTTECLFPKCGDGYTYRGVESCDAGPTKNGVPCTAPYAGLCNYCTVDCQYKTKTGDYCGDGKKNGPEVCEGSEAEWLGCLKSDNATGSSERDDSRSCTIENEVGAATNTACKVGYTCRKLGVCNGGSRIGKPCTLGSALTGANIFSCGANFECTAPHCSTTCDAMCPFNFGLATLTATSPVPNSRPQSSIKLYSVDKGTPDSATLHFPACSAAQSLVADINMDGVEKPDVDVVFVTDVSGSMETGDRIVAARDSVAKAIDDLFSGYTAATLRIGIVRFGTAKKICNNGSNAGNYCFAQGDCPNGTCVSNSSNLSCQGGDKDGQSCSVNADCTNNGYCVAVKIDHPLSPITSKEVMKQTVSLYKAEGETPTFGGVNRGIEVLKASNPSAVKILILLSDGNPNSVRFCVGGANQGKACLNNSHCPNSTCDAEDVIRHVGAVRDLIDAETNQSIRVFSAAITNDTSLIGYMAHMSNDVCRTSWISRNDCQPREGVEYAFKGISSNEIASMYQGITNTILGAVVSFTTAVGSQVTVSEPLPLKSGVNQAIPFPSAFACNNQSQNAPFQLNFTGTGQVELSKMKFTYCPARPR